MPPSELSYQPDMDPIPRSPRSARSGILQPTKGGSRAGRRTEDEPNANKTSWNGHNRGGVRQREEDLDSNFQEQSTSEVGHVGYLCCLTPFVNTNHVHAQHEPGPNDPPHGFYPSYSSWGNMGPLPGTAHNSFQVCHAGGVIHMPP